MRLLYTAFDDSHNNKNGQPFDGLAKVDGREENVVGKPGLLGDQTRRNSQRESRLERI